MIALVTFYFYSKAINVYYSKHSFTIPLCTVHDRKASYLAPEKYGINYLGEYNNGGQTAGFELLPESQTVVGIQEQNYGIFCWDYQKPLTPYTVKLVAGGRDLVPFLVDIKVDRSCQDLSLIVLSNNLPDIAYNKFCHDTKNFRIFTVKMEDVLAAYPECTSNKPHQCQGQTFPSYAQHSAFYDMRYKRRN